MEACHKSVIWENVSEEDWSDWHWQLKNRITDGDGLAKLIPLSSQEKKEIDLCLQNFRMTITPYYASLINAGDANCPIRKQCIPSIRELDIRPCELEDSLAEDKFSPVPNIVHRYPDRVLFLLTKKCSMYCRHCTRRRMVGEEDFSISRRNLGGAIQYIVDNPQIRDVLLSGGDPFILDDRFLEEIIDRVRAIPHVEIIRIGTRTPVVMPMRITSQLLDMLKKYHPIWINTHFNHPAEITEASAQVCRKIADAGIPLGNQSVLLRGINDDVEILKTLFLKLVHIRVRPYYLYQCDVARGLHHFRTPVQKGVEIMQNLRGYISGYAVPTFVIDAPMGGGKIPINPEYVVELNDQEVVMKNYKGELYHYPNVI